MATLLALGAAVLLLGTWVGYPLLIGVIARLRPKASTSAGGSPPAVSVVVCTRGPADQVRWRVDNLLGIAWPQESVDLVVALDASTAPDVEQEIRLACPGARVVRSLEKAGKAGAVNAGVAAATNEIVVMCDTAQRFDHDTLVMLARHMMDPAFGAVSGRLELSEESQGTLVGHYWRYERTLRAAEARVHSAVGVTGAVYALRKSAFRPLPGDVILDDVYTPMDMVLRGYRVGFAEGAVARETRTPDVAQEGRRKERTLTGVLQLVVRLPGIMRPWKNAIFTQFVCHKLLRLGTPAFILALAAGGLVLGWEWLRTWPTVPRNVVLVVMGITLGAMLLVARIRRLLHEFVAMQVAIVRAFWRAVRGAWDVW